jgi:uncharacterized protein (TIRG00374 family)
VSRGLRLALSIAIALALLSGLVLWGGVDPLALATAWRRLPLATLLGALAIHAGIQALRAQRLRVLIPPSERRPPFGQVLAISAAHNMAAYVLPARTGEASLVVYLRGTSGVTTGEGVACLMVSRIADLGILCAWLALSSIALGVRGGPGAGTWLLWLGLALALAAAAILWLGARSERLVRLAVSLSRALRLDRGTRRGRLVARVEGFAATLALAGGGGRFARAALVSVPLWAGVFAFYALLARGAGLGPELDFLQAVFGSSLAVLTNILPVNGLAGFGTQEAGWVAGFGLLGVGREAALTSGVAVHLAQLFNTCLFGLLGHLALAARRPRRPPDRPGSVAPPRDR